MRLLYLFLMLFHFLHSNGQTAVWQEKAGVALNNLSLYSDSTFAKPTNIFCKEGDLFEILGKTTRLYEDDAQKQLFYWYRVRTQSGITGWIFGDAIAVSAPAQQLSPALKALQKKQFSKERILTWIAAVDGGEMPGETAAFSPPYREEYLVVTLENEKSFPILIGNESNAGFIELSRADISDITGDGLAEWIIQRNSYSPGQRVESRNLEVFGLWEGNFQKLFSEELTLTTAENQSSPAKFKVVELNSKSIRVGYMDYLSCKNYRQHFSTDAGKLPENCLEYVTYTYLWNPAEGKFKLLYEPSRSAPEAGLRNDGVFLHERPELKSKRVELLSKNIPLSVIKEVKTGRREFGLSEYWLYVYAPSGVYGYLPASKIGFVHCEHADLLNKFYNGEQSDEREGTYLRIKTKAISPDQ